MGRMSIDRGKRVEPEPGDVARFGPFRLLFAARLLERNGEPVEVGGRALDILVELVNQAGRVVSKTELMTAIWRDSTVVEGVVRTHVYNLRKSLGDGVGGARYITSQGIPPMRVTRVPYTTDVAAFSAMPVERPDAETISLVYAGLLIPRKGILEFLRLLSAWAQRHPYRRIEFQIAGDGPQRAALDAVSRPPNLAVRFLGNVAYDELPHVYGRSSILVLPTLEDEWGVVVNEAMAAGLPILGSVYSQAVEELVIDGKTGWTFVPDDQRSAHAALDAALNTSGCDRACMARAARAHASALTPTRIAREIASAIDRVITPSPIRA